MGDGIAASNRLIMMDFVGMYFPFGEGLYSYSDVQFLQSALN